MTRFGVPLLTVVLLGAGVTPAPARVQPKASRALTHVRVFQGPN